MATYSGTVRISCVIELDITALDIQGAGYTEVDAKSIKAALEMRLFEDYSADDEIDCITSILAHTMNPDDDRHCPDGSMAE